MLNQAKQLSEELMSKAKSEKAYHEQLIEKLRSESKSFKDSLLSLYESQMDRLGDMVDLKPQVDEDQAHIDSVESEMNQIISNIDEINKLQSQTVDAPTEEPRHRRRRQRIPRATQTMTRWIRSLMRSRRSRRPQPARRRSAAR